MAVKTARINTVSFSYSNVAKNGLVCKPGDILTLVEGTGGQMFIDLATPESAIIGICDDKKVFPETNETQELGRVNYTPVAWDNTYKMEVSGSGTPKIGYFYTMTDDQKIDLTSASPSVGQFMVQDVNDSYIEVRFVTNQGLAIPQYEDVRLESISETNPESDPFDGLYTFTLSNGTEISGDFSALALYLGDITITGNLTTTGNITSQGDLSVTGDTTMGDVTAGDITAGDITSSGDIETTGNTVVGGTLTVTGNTTLGNVTATNTTSNSISTTTITSQGGAIGITGNVNITGNQTNTGNTRLIGNLTVDNSSHFKEDVDMDEDLNVDGNIHVAGTATVDSTLSVNGQLNLGPNATAPQFILQTEKNQPSGVAGLDSNGKLSPSVIPASNFAFYYETTSAGATTYTLQHSPISDSAVMVFTDSGTALFPTTDYTCANGVLTFSNLGSSEHAIIRVVSQS